MSQENGDRCAYCVTILRLRILTLDRERGVEATVSQLDHNNQSLRIFDF